MSQENVQRERLQLIGVLGLVVVAALNPQTSLAVISAARNRSVFKDPVEFPDDVNILHQNNLCIVFYDYLMQILVPCSIEQVLDSLPWNWIPWTSFPAYGTGIYTLEQFGINAGQCTILVNGRWRGVNNVNHLLKEGSILQITPI